MAESHVVSGLLSKREEIAGQITTIQAEIGRLQGALTHLDNTIKPFSPQYDLRTIKGKRTYMNCKNFERGEAQRMKLGVLREIKNRYVVVKLLMNCQCVKILNRLRRILIIYRKIF